MRKLPFILLLFLSWSCANIVSPIGGSKDEIPPRLKKSSPPLNTVYFEGGEFHLEFDEIVVLDNVNKQLVVSPPLKEKPSVKAMKKKISVKFDKSDLQENTTYSFNFGLSIKDYNEGNILKNFKYVFSTGSYIDSLTLSGKVIDSFSEDPVENVAVLMYRNLEDSMPLTSMPNYFGITDKEGHYDITNIKNGTYKMFALLDMNQNYLYDLPSEKIAFLDEAVVLDSSLTDINFNLFGEDHAKQYIIKKEIEPYGRVSLIFNESLNDLDIILKDQVFDKNDYIYKLYPNKDSLKIWFPDFEDSFTLIIKDDTTFADTLDMKVVPVFTLDDMPPFTITPNLSGTVDLNKTLELHFENPITSWKPEFISLFEDSVEIEIDSYFTDSSKTALRIPHEWKEKSKYLLMVGLGAFVDFYNQKNDVYELRFGAQEQNFYGRLNMNIDLGETTPPYIFQLLNVELNVLNEMIIDESQTVSYSYLRPAEYTFRLIQDLNANGVWDTGDYSEKRQPEPVIYYPAVSKVRSNWELDLEWGIEVE
jgi:hypothetical protein